MAKNSGQPRRDLLSAHNVGAGKGDAPRTNLGSKQWREGYDGIDWSGSVTGFRREGNRLVKSYGPRPEKIEFMPLDPPEEFLIGCPGCGYHDINCKCR